MKKGKGADQLGFALAKLGFADWSMRETVGVPHTPKEQHE